MHRVYGGNRGKHKQLGHKQIIREYAIEERRERGVRERDSEGTEGNVIASFKQTEAGNDEVHSKPVELWSPCGAL